LEFGINHFKHRRDVAVNLIKLFIRNRLTVDRYALVQRNQVRASEPTGSQAMLAQNSFDKSRG
jgi:hypothetical protein